MAKQPKFSEIIGIDPEMLLFMTQEDVKEIEEIDPAAAILMALEMEEVQRVHRNRRMN